MKRSRARYSKSELFGAINVALMCLALAIPALVAGCNSSNSPSKDTSEETAAYRNNGPGSSQDWVAQEVLMQLKEMRTDISAMKSSLTKLSDEVAKLKANNVVNPTEPQRDSVARDQNIELAGLPTLGKGNAAVAIVEFSDFECPFCLRHYREVFPQIKKAYIDNGKVKYMSRQFPLPFHSYAKSAAIAALCAERQEKYWPMRDALFNEKSGLNTELYTSAAKSLGLNLKRFEACLSDKTTVERVSADINYGDSIGVSGTPKFFIGRVSGQRLTDISVLDGAQPFERFASAINQKLQK